MHVAAPSHWTGWSESNDLDLHIRMVLDSCLGRDICYPRGFRGFPQYILANAWAVPRLRLNCFLPNPFQFISYPTILRYMVSISKYRQIPPPNIPSVAHTSSQSGIYIQGKILQILFAFICTNNETISFLILYQMNFYVYLMMLSVNQAIITSTFPLLFPSSFFWSVPKITSCFSLLFPPWPSCTLRLTSDSHSGTSAVVIVLWTIPCMNTKGL
jgi:hypothetical protein